MTDSKTHFYILTLILFAVFLLLVAIITKMMRFKREKDLIMMELNRCEDKEISYWKNELRTLYISMIPLIGYIYKKMRGKEN